MEKTAGIKTALVITGGYCNTELAKKQLPSLPDIIIAADSGYDTAKKLGVQPNIAVGDFDSLKSRLPEGLETIRVACEKDVTDTMLACEYAKDRGCGEITIVGGTGGRADHFLSNVFFLEELLGMGIRARLTDGENTVRFVENETVKIPSEGGYFSVLAVTECIVTESGCKYPLDRAKLVRTRPYAVSNEVTSSEATLTVEGTAILVTSCQ